MSNVTKMIRKRIVAHWRLMSRACGNIGGNYGIMHRNKQFKTNNACLPLHFISIEIATIHVHVIF